MNSTCKATLLDGATADGPGPENTVTNDGGCWVFYVSGTFDGAVVEISRRGIQPLDPVPGPWVKLFTIPTPGDWYWDIPRYPKVGHVRAVVVGAGAGTDITIEAQQHPICDCCPQNPDGIDTGGLSEVQITTTQVPGNVAQVEVFPPAGRTWSDLFHIYVRKLAGATEPLGLTGEIDEDNNLVYLAGQDTTPGQHEIVTKWVVHS